MDIWLILYSISGEKIGDHQQKLKKIMKKADKYIYIIYNINNLYIYAYKHYLNIEYYWKLCMYAT